MIDPIVEEVRKIRYEHAKRFNFDLDAICADLRELQKTCGHLVVSFPPKPLVSVKGTVRTEKPID